MFSGNSMILTILQMKTNHSLEKLSNLLKVTERLSGDTEIQSKKMDLGCVLCPKSCCLGAWGHLLNRSSKPNHWGFSLPWSRQPTPAWRNPEQLPTDLTFACKLWKRDIETVLWSFGSVGKYAPFPLPAVTADHKYIQESHVSGDKEKVETQFHLQIVTCFLQ